LNKDRSLGYGISSSHDQRRWKEETPIVPSHHPQVQGYRAGEEQKQILAALGEIEDDQEVRTARDECLKSNLNG
jgi:hypothetical protein